MSESPSRIISLSCRHSVANLIAQAAASSSAWSGDAAVIGEADSLPIDVMYLPPSLMVAP